MAASVWTVLAEEGPALRGGICVELGEDGELPLEAALRGLGVNTEALYDPARRRRSSELTKLWVARGARGRGLGLALIRAGIALSRRLRLAEVHTLAPDHTIHHFCALGGEIHRNVGDRGSFAYPTTAYRSWFASLRL